ncbi:lipoprotein-anchoring transpeptidase ErfK/SrfK [Prauserella sediminis]|uniref:Lipoprotein-anchoring transpeptidase ErfK/SrfK n=1 Tax=Prauserella sediminis TaxID=577680 RepID=A0A839XNS3_9PSEU|nr:Ig-like domain-containing protein [Prauserella sediminis]MBB3663134.1 lipoprotein-anchoring transpeptidase ErfK/SrfK [Prauserella sediminis]
MIALTLTAMLWLAACTGSTPQQRNAGMQDSTPEPAPAAEVDLRPGDGEADVEPRDDVSVTVEHGTLDNVTLTADGGEQVDGELAENGRSWTATERLGYGKRYRWTGTATNAEGKESPVTGSFETVKPTAIHSASLNVGDGGTYGVAMPISITFDEPVENKAAVERALSVETSTATEGSWAWLELDTAVHWRPKEYWQPGTEVSVSGDLYGLELSDGAYAESDVSSTFTIGRRQLVRANTQSHRMKVFVDGKQTADYPASFGLDSDPGRVTRSGTHVVMTKHSEYYMNNPAYDYEDFRVEWAVRISNNGEFTHAAPWSVGSQGYDNVSHGCINLAPADALEYYNLAQTGDPFEVRGSSVPLGPRDGDYHDWSYSWSEWTSMSALQD